MLRLRPTHSLDLIAGVIVIADCDPDTPPNLESAVKDAVHALGDHPVLLRTDKRWNRVHHVHGRYPRLDIGTETVLEAAVATL